MGCFIDGNVQGYSSLSAKTYKATKQAVCCTKNLHGIVWNSGRLGFTELPNALPRGVCGESFAKRTEKCNILSSLVDRVMG